MTDIRHEIELVTPGLNLLEDHGEGAKSVIERTKKTLHQAADRIEELETCLKDIRIHCKYDYPPNARAIIMFINTALVEKTDD